MYDNSKSRKLSAPGERAPRGLRHTSFSFAAEYAKREVPFENQEQRDHTSPRLSKDDLNLLFRRTATTVGKWTRLHQGTIISAREHGNGDGNGKDAEHEEIIRRRQTLERLLEPPKEGEAVPLKPIDPKDFLLMSDTGRPPSSAMPSSSSKRNNSNPLVPTKTHYDFFEEICPGSGLRRQSTAMKAGALQRLKSKLSDLDSNASNQVDSWSLQSQTPQTKALQPQAEKKAQLPALNRGSSTEAGWNFQPGTKLSSAKRSACEAIRIVVLGRIGNEDAKTDREKMKIFEEARGSDKEVISLYKSWKELDEDESGDCDLREFLKYFRNRGLTSVGERALKGIFGSQNSGSTFSLEHLMKIVWPCCQTHDVNAMQRVITEYKLSDQQIEETQPLSEEAFSEISDVFVTANASKSGVISKKELVACGLFDEERAVETIAKYGMGPGEGLNWEQFLEVMCPAGFSVPPEFKRRLPATAASRNSP